MKRYEKIIKKTSTVCCCWWWQLVVVGWLLLFFLILIKNLKELNPFLRVTSSDIFLGRISKANYQTSVFQYFFYPEYNELTTLLLHAFCAKRAVIQFCSHCITQLLTLIEEMSAVIDSLTHSHKKKAINSLVNNGQS